MEEIFITKIDIKLSGNITNLEIPLSGAERKHLILTGKNGSGKTTLIDDLKNRIQAALFGVQSEGIVINFSNFDSFLQQARADEFLIAFFNARRNTEFNVPKGIQKLELNKNPPVDPATSKDFIQYIVNLRADKLFAKDEGELEDVERLDNWFNRFEKRLGEIFDSPKIELKFDRKNYNFNIIEDGKLPYNLNMLSDGYSAILSIATELILRMEAHDLKAYDLEGIVFIDEIETHLHVELQKKILPFLTDFFPKIQFIVTTHSPFVLSSIANAVICDLEKRIVTSDLSGYSYDTLIESYFDSDKYSDLLKDYVREYENLSDKEDLTDSEKDRLYELKLYLKEIPKFVSDELAVKIQQIKLKNLGSHKKK